MFYYSLHNFLLSSNRILPVLFQAGTFNGLNYIRTYLRYYRQIVRNVILLRIIVGAFLRFR